VSATVQFNREPCGRAIEIEYVIIDWMLATKFVAGEISITQMRPKNALGISRLLSQQATTLHEASL
jgi:hypothetical protein